MLKNAEIADIVSKIRAQADLRTQENVAKATESTVQERTGRVLELIKDLERIDIVIKERSVAEENQDVPGGKTGIVVVDYKHLAGKGLPPERVKTHAVDDKIIARRQSLLEQIAVELGQRVLKTEAVKRKSIDEMTVEELRELAGEMDRAETRIQADRDNGGSQVVHMQ